ncbi:MAG: hypothetical protein LBU07_05485 [Coriobacteriales bacterium]|jgi:hypothetical protein|nr:hypothetical protein [Coriobacteriales bacterium]
MSKLLLHIQVPAAHHEFDFWVPQGISVHVATRLIASIIEEQAPAFFSDGSQVALYRVDDGSLIDPNQRIYELHLGNGSYLYCF